MVVFRFLDEPRRWHPALIGALIALGFATKETMYIAGFVAFTFFGSLLLREGARRARRRARVAVGRLGGLGVGAGRVRGRLHADVHGLPDQPGGAVGRRSTTASHYWLGQHDVGRGGEQPYFYVVVLFGDEWPVLLLGGVGAVLAFRQPTVLRAFLVWAFALSLAIYSWAGEKFAWLVLHPLLPLILLAGLGVQALWEARGTRSGRAGLAVAAVAALYVPSRRGWATSSSAPTRASCWSPRSPPRRSSASPTRSWRWRARSPSCRSRSTPPTARRSPTRGTSATSTSATSTSRTAAAPPDSDVLIMTEAQPQRLRRSWPPTRAAASRSASGGCATTEGRRPPPGCAGIASARSWNPTGGMPE